MLHYTRLFRINSPSLCFYICVCALSHDLLSISSPPRTTRCCCELPFNLFCSFFPSTSHVPIPMSAFVVALRQPSLFQMSDLSWFAFVRRDLRLAEFQGPIAGPIKKKSVPGRKYTSSDLLTLQRPDDRRLPGVMHGPHVCLGASIFKWKPTTTGFRRPNRLGEQRLVHTFPQVLSRKHQRMGVGSQRISGCSHFSIYQIRYSVDRQHRRERNP